MQLTCAIICSHCKTSVSKGKTNGLSLFNCTDQRAKKETIVGMSSRKWQG